MDQSIKVYSSNIRTKKKSKEPGALRTVLHAKAIEISDLERRHPITVLVLNSIIAVLIVALCISLFTWHLENLRVEKREQQAAIALAEQKAFEEQQEQERQAAILAEQQKRAEQQLADTTLMAKFLAGINGFVDNYGYSDGDLRTYAECVINRVIDKSHGFPNTISEVILQDGQWVGFSENNQVIDKYNKIATEVIASYYNNAVRPCSSDYCWVELRRDGCWLKNEFGNSPYIRTWRYSA